MSVSTEDHVSKKQQQHANQHINIIDHLTAQVGYNIHGTDTSAGGLGQLANITSGMNYKLYVHQGGTKQYHVPFGYTLPKQCYFLVQFEQMKNDVNS
jgi:hypothetical protein